MESSLSGRRLALRRGSAGRSALLFLGAALLVALGVHLTGRVNLAMSRPTAAEIGSRAPDFELEEVGTGQKLRLSSLQGKPVVLCFYCGCGLCRAAAIKWSESKDKLPDVHIIAVIGDHSAYNPVTVKDFKWGTGWEWPVLADIGTRVTLEYKSIDCPQCWVIDSDGIIRQHNKDRTEPADAIVGNALAALRSLKS